MEGQEFVLCHHDLSEGAQKIALLLQDGEVTIEDIAEYMGRAAEEATFDTKHRAGIKSELLAEYFEAIGKRLRDTWGSGNNDRVSNLFRILNMRLFNRVSSR